jgi:hypothetical protein
MFEFLTRQPQSVARLGGQLSIEKLEDRAVPAVISGVTYQDLNLDGTRQANEPGISGVRITLYSNDNQVVATTTTDANGRYQFTVRDAIGSGPTIRYPSKFFLLGGTYGRQTVQRQDFIIRQTQPENWINFTNNELRVSVTQLNQQITGQNFGEILPGSISGRVYYDANKSGTFNSGESGIAGVVIVLTGADAFGNSVQLTTTTNAQGQYRFEGLMPGSYNLQEFQPTGYDQGSTNVGTLGGTAGLDTISGVRLGQGEEGREYNFGETRNSVPPPDPIRTITYPSKFFLLGGVYRRR